MAQLFGFEIKRKDPNQEIKSVVSPTPDDGATIVSGAAAAHYGLAIDLEGVVKNESDLIRRYRESAQYADCDMAIEDIVSEAIVSDSDSAPVTLVLDDLKVSESIKNKMRDEFDNVLKLYKFDEKGHDIFRQWYIDGRIHYHIIIDEKQPKNGILELRPVDPRKIRKIKNVVRDRNDRGVEVVKQTEEFYLYNDRGITEQTTQGVKLSVDSVITCTSGLTDPNTGMVLSYLHKAIKPVNQLKVMEDALVIYRMSRAPERRIFYIDVGNLPKTQAEQYVNSFMNKFRNKVVYNATTGEVSDSRNHLSMMEDFWMPRREGGKGTEITTLQGGQNLGQIEDINYFQNKLYQALNVPISRLTPNQSFSLGRTNEITRDEIKFGKFVNRLRKKFATIFAAALRVQLIAKGIIRADEWPQISDKIRFDYQKDNHFTEMKNSEIMNQRMALLTSIDPYVGKYYSIDWVRQNVLMQTEEEIKEIEQNMEEDRAKQLAFAGHQGAMADARGGEDPQQDPNNNSTGEQ